METKEITNVGRGIAHQWLTHALNNSTNPNELNTQLHILDTASVHVLATNMFNKFNSLRGTEKEVSKMSLIMEAKELIENELELLFENAESMETIKPEVD